MPRVHYYLLDDGNDKITLTGRLEAFLIHSKAFHILSHRHRLRNHNITADRTPKCSIRRRIVPGNSA